MAQEEFCAMKIDGKLLQPLIFPTRDLRKKKHCDGRCFSLAIHTFLPDYEIDHMNTE